MASSHTHLSRRMVMGLLGSTALVHVVGGATQARSASAQSYRAPPEMVSAPKLGQGAFAGEAWDAYTQSFSDFVETHNAVPIERERPPLSLEPDDYMKVDRFYAVSPKSREGIELTQSDGTLSTLWAPVYEDMLPSPTQSLRAVGPTMEFTRGEITGVWVKNTLQVCGDNPRIEPTATDAGYTPHNFDYTNLHTHGLHVSPRAPSDDVLVTIVPDAIKDTCSTHPGAITAKDPATFPYFYDVPDNHPVGTFWYHPHMHGSVASQVGPGMSGALLIRSAEGEIDFDEALEIHCGITRADERVMVVQDISFSSLAAPGALAGVYVARNTYGPTEQNFTCTPSILPGTPSYDVGTPAASATSINGAINPTLAMRPGEILRFRMVNATNGNNYIPKFSALGTVPPGQALPEIYAIAVDGIPIYPVDPADDPDGVFSPDTPYFRIDFDQPRPADGDTSLAAKRYWTTAELITLAPAQRLDLLVKAPDIGAAESLTFQLAGAAQYDTPVNGSDPGTPSKVAPNVLDNEKEGGATTDALITLVVSGAPRTDQSLPSMGFFDTATLRGFPGLSEATLTRPELPLAPKEQQPASLSTGAMIARWTADHVSAAETAPGAPLGVTDPHWKSLEFAYVAKPDPDGTQANFQINGQSFDANLADDPQLELPVDGWTSWELFSSNDLHMFHIHINSFMVLGRYRVNAQDDPEAIESFASYLFPIWRDTVYFDAGNDNTAGPLTGRRVAALSYQIDFTGEFVFHCHSLYHEDNGMMFTVEIA